MGRLASDSDARDSSCRRASISKSCELLDWRRALSWGGEGGNYSLLWPLSKLATLCVLDSLSLASAYGESKRDPEAYRVRPRLHTKQMHAETATIDSRRARISSEPAYRDEACSDGPLAPRMDSHCMAKVGVRRLRHRSACRPRAGCTRGLRGRMNARHLLCRANTMALPRCSPRYSFQLSIRAPLPGRIGIG